MDEDNSKTSSLHAAILNNDIEKVQQFIKEGADVNLPDSKGLRPLHVAIITNNIKIIELLIYSPKIESDISAWQWAAKLDNAEIWNLLSYKYNRVDLQKIKNSQGETLVHFSVRCRSIKTLDKCIRCKLNINDVDVYGYSPLHLAVINNDTKIVGLLLKAGADVYAKTLDGRSSIHFAVKYKNFETLLMLIDSNVNVNDPMSTNGFYPLHIAVENNDESTVNLLIRAGGDIDCKDKEGRNLLHVAVENQHLDMVNMLLKKGVDVNARFGEEEKSVLELALISRKSQIISAILNYNPDLNSKNKNGLSALFIAIKMNCVKARKEIFLLKPDFSAVTNDNSSLLHYALICQVEYIVNYLLENNINIKAIDNEGYNALHYAILYSDEKIVSQLINKNLDVNSRTKTNSTPLHLAVMGADFAVVEILLNNGADINAEDIHKQTPLFYGLTNDVQNKDKREKIVKLLLDKGANVNLFDNAGKTPLYYLNFHELCDSKELSLLFIQLGANVSKVSNCNDNSLHIYLRRGNDVDLINLFLDNGANINQVNNSNQTPLEVYLETNRASVDTVAFLINKGATMNKNKMGENALHLAVKNQSEEIVRLLLEKKFTELNDTTVDGSTALHYAVKETEFFNRKTINTLLTYNVEINAKDKEGKTALHLAVIRNWIEIVKILLSNNADVNIKDVYENSPLCYAISNKDLSMIKLLLQNGACISDTHRGLSICDLAEQTGNKDIYDMILLYKNGDND